MSSNFKFELHSFKAGTFKMGAEQKLPYLFISGRGEQGVWGRVRAHGEEAAAFKKVLDEHETTLAGLRTRLVVEAVGEWSGDKNPEGVVVNTSFEAVKLSLVTGARAILTLSEIDAVESLEKADAFRRIAEGIAVDPTAHLRDAMEMLMRGYQELEASISRFTRRPPPSRTPEIDLENPIHYVAKASPEDVAQAKFDAQDAIRGRVLGQRDEVVVEAPPEQPKGQEPEAHQGEFAQQAEAPVADQASESPAEGVASLTVEGDDGAVPGEDGRVLDASAGEEAASAASENAFEVADAATEALVAPQSGADGDGLDAAESDADEHEAHDEETHDEETHDEETHGEGTREDEQAAESAAAIVPPAPQAPAVVVASGRGRPGVGRPLGRVGRPGVAVRPADDSAGPKM